MNSPHLGDPCIHCNVSHDAVPSGPCVENVGLAAHTRTKLYWEKLIAEHDKKANAEHDRLRNLIVEEVKAVALLGSGFDESKISLAESFLFAATYANGGDDRQSVLNDAIKWFADETVGYQGLRKEFFGTKNYDRWRGQRSDHGYGYGPSHGSTCFAVGIKDGFREREFNADEKDAAIYYLMNLPMIQKVRSEAIA
jgi:hypothetical protein